MAKKQPNLELIWEIGAKLVDNADIAMDKLQYTVIPKAYEVLLEFCASIIIWYDKIADIIEWFAKRTFVIFARRLHEIRMGMQKYQKVIIKDATILFVLCILAIALYGTVIKYEYSYNGRPLGIVREQRDVLEILELVSEELTQEYGSSIKIDPETDITFKPVLASRKDIDDVDTVLKRFTYMGDIQAQAYGIVVEGKRIITVESESIANSVLEQILKEFTPDEDAVYEYVGFAEDIDIEPYNTTLANVSSKAAALKRIRSGGQQEVSYKVVAGDTIYGICSKLGVKFEELQKMNPGLTLNTTLHIGDKFVIQQEVPLLTVETVEVSSFAETIKYDTVYKESKNYYVGEQVVTRAGTNGKAKITARLTRHNGKIVDRQDISKVVIKEPTDKIVVKGTKPIPPKKGTGTFIRPVNVSVYRGYGMRWGRMHYGLDYAAPTGTTIRAADGGTVTKAGWSGAYGYRIVIDHGANKKTLYAHCNSINVRVGEQVYQGQKIGTVGNTGRSTGPHCHFELFVNGANVNPSRYM